MDTLKEKKKKTMKDFHNQETGGRTDDEGAVCKNRITKCVVTKADTC